MIEYVFRKLTYPLICDVEGVLIGAESLADFRNQAAKMDLPPAAQLPIVDASAGSWAFYTDLEVLAPAFRRSRWTKKTVIEMFNDSKTAQKLRREYPVKSLSSKQFRRIVTDIVKLIKAADEGASDTTDSR